MIIEAILKINPNASVSVVGNTDDLADAQISWDNGTTPISNEDIQAKLDSMPTIQEEMEASLSLKASAKAKLIAGEALTEDEANTIVLYMDGYAI